MLIGDKYKIESDSLNIIFFRRTKSKKNGSDRWRAEAYFATVKNALTYLVDMEVRETGLQDLKQVTKKQDELYALIKSLNLPGEPPVTIEVAVKPHAGNVAELVGVQNDAAGCNNGGDKENYSARNVTAQNKPNVTAKIGKLAKKGLSSRAIAEVLQSEGINISHMTVSRAVKKLPINAKNLARGVK